MDDAVTAPQPLGKQRLVSQVALDLLKPRMVLDGVQHILAVEVEIQHADLMPRGEQPGHEHRADIAGTARDKNGPGVIRHRGTP